MKKKYLSILLSLALVLPCAFSAAAAEQDFYPDVTYDATAESELDAWGKWKYRNLLPREGEEKTTSTEIGFIGDKTKTAPVGKDTTDKINGNYSWKTTLQRGDTTRFKIDGLLEKNETNGVSGKYYASGYFKASFDDGTVRNGGIPFTWQRNWTNYESKYRKIHPDNLSCQAQRNFPKEGATDDNTATNLLIKPEWTRITQTYEHQYGDSAPWTCTKTEQTDDAGNTIWQETTPQKRTSTMLMFSCNLESTYKGKDVTLNFDEMSFRLIPAEGECIAYTKSTTTADTPIAVAEEVCFSFSNDIDYATVTKDSVKLNGTAYDSTAIRWDVNEQTRENKLYIKFAVLNPDNEYTVELSEIKDAWGRDIVGTNKTTIKTLPAVERTAQKFETASGEISAIAAGAITPKVSLKSNVGEVNAVVIAAVCDGNKIISLSSREVALTATATEYSLDPVIVTDTKQNIRLFVWTKDDTAPTPRTKYGTFSSNGWTEAAY